MRRFFDDHPEIYTDTTITFTQLDQCFAEDLTVTEDFGLPEDLTCEITVQHIEDTNVIYDTLTINFPVDITETVLYISSTEVPTFVSLVHLDLISTVTRIADIG